MIENDRHDLIRAALFTAGMAGALWLFLHVVWSPGAWPAPERPPLQGEAVDAASFAKGRVVHSAEALARLVREPQNAWSNLAYVFAGALIGAHFRGRLIRGVALAMIAVGLGSFLYHASASGKLRAVDVWTMYVLYGHLALLAVASFSPRFAAWCERWASSLTVGLFVAGGAVTLCRSVSVWGVRPFDIMIVTAAVALVLSAALLTHAVRARRWQVWGRLAVTVHLFSLAAACQIGDRAGGWCWNPHGILQGHAVWHVLSAAAGGLAMWELAGAARELTARDNDPKIVA